MIAKEFIDQTRIELDEKGSKKHWNDNELFIKLQRAYVSLQFDLPYFMCSEELQIQEGKDSYDLKFVALKNIEFSIDKTPIEYSDIENIYLYKDVSRYSFDEDRLLLNFIPQKNGVGTIRYRYEKTLETMNCVIDIPQNYRRALRLLFMSEIHEKPILNTKERNLSSHYLGLYEKEIFKLGKLKKIRSKNLVSQYQII